MEKRNHFQGAERPDYLLNSVCVLCMCVFMGFPWFLSENVKGDSLYLIRLMNVSLKVIKVGHKYLHYPQGPEALAHLLCHK